jgi:hypothetical protein
MDVSSSSGNRVDTDCDVRPFPFLLRGQPSRAAISIAINKVKKKILQLDQFAENYPQNIDQGSRLNLNTPASQKKTKAVIKGFFFTTARISCPAEIFG